MSSQGEPHVLAAAASDLQGAWNAPVAAICAEDEEQVHSELHGFHVVELEACGLLLF